MPVTSITKYIKELARIETSDTLFNPYNEVSSPSDKNTAPGIRQQNLRLVLNAYYKSKPDMIWVFETPSYLEAKNSGVPLVNQANFLQVKQILDLKRNIERAVKSKETPDKSLTASVIWRIIEEMEIKPLIWNACPFYPHKKNNIAAGRNISKKELIEHKILFTKLTDIYKPKSICAIGKGAKRAMDILEIKTKYLDHPVYIGTDKFKSKVKRIQRSL